MNRWFYLSNLYSMTNISKGFETGRLFQISFTFKFKIYIQTYIMRPQAKYYSSWNPNRSAIHSEYQPFFRAQKSVSALLNSITSLRLFYQTLAVSCNNRRTLREPYSYSQQPYKYYTGSNLSGSVSPKLMTYPVISYALSRDSWHNQTLIMLIPPKSIQPIGAINGCQETQIKAMATMTIQLDFRDLVDRVEPLRSSVALDDLRSSVGLEEPRRSSLVPAELSWLCFLFFLQQKTIVF